MVASGARLEVFEAASLTLANTTDQLAPSYFYQLLFPLRESNVAGARPLCRSCCMTCCYSLAGKIRSAPRALVRDHKL
eukprot:1816274-Pyramimonas_sp.AAC.1